MSIWNSLIVRIKGDSADLDNTLNKTGTRITAWAGKIAGLFGLAFSTRAIVDFAKEASKLAAEAEGVKKAFAALGTESQQILADMKKATRGVIDESDLMAIAIRAKNFNIPLQDLSRYLEFATKRAITTGKSVAQLSELIVTGLGRKSSRSMIELGLSAEKVQEAFKSTSGFMDLISGEIEKMGDVSDTTSVKFDRLGTSLKNFKEAIGEKINTGGFFQNVLGGLDIWLNKLTSAAPSKFAGMSDEELETKKKSLESWKDELFGTLEHAQGYLNDLPKGGLLNALLYGRDRKSAEETITKTEREIEGIKNDIKEINQLLSYVPPAGSSGSVLGITRAAGIPSAGTGNLSFPTFAPAPGPDILSGTHAGDAIAEAIEARKEKWSAMLDQAKSELVLQAEDFIQSLFMALSSGNWSDIGHSLLEGFANFLSILGMLLIAFALSCEAFQTTVENILTWPVALAAGIAAIATAGLIKGAISRGTEAVTGGTSGASASRYSASGSGASLDNMKVVIEGQLRGKDIYWSGKRYAEEYDNGT